VHHYRTKQALKTEINIKPMETTQLLWKTRDGERIPVNDLDDFHLECIVRMFLKTIPKSKLRECVEEIIKLREYPILEKDAFKPGNIEAKFREAKIKADEEYYEEFIESDEHPHRYLYGL
jgi:hypothetical protein